LLVNVPVVGKTAAVGEGNAGGRPLPMHICL
jgi:hypothetical protein